MPRPATTSRPPSPSRMITGEPIEIQTGPNWDDDLGGSNIYARNDPNLADLPEHVRQQMAELERIVFNYLPRICNHCLNPACVAACPSGAIYKRAEDGVVLVNENKCRAWRMCVAACPYKKVYYNWSTGKSEKCILCFPRLETGQAPACAHSCVGRIRYMGVLLYDADRIPGAAMVPDDELVEAQRAVILDPFDPEVIAAARANGIEESWISAAQNSPAYKFVKAVGTGPAAAPRIPHHGDDVLHPAALAGGQRHRGGAVQAGPAARTSATSSCSTAWTPPACRCNTWPTCSPPATRRPSARPCASCWRCAPTCAARRSTATVDEKTLALLAEAGTNPAEVEAIYRLTTLPTLAERFVIPQYHREMAVEAWTDPLAHKGETGFGYVQAPQRGE